MSFCLPKTIADKFIRDLPQDISSLINKTSAERRAIFEKSVGPENARQVNAAFESKLLLKNQQKGLINWVENIAGLKEPIKRDLLSRIQKMDEILTPENKAAFLEDLVAQRLGFGVTFKEAGKIADLAKTVEAKQAIVKESMPKSHTARLDYGNALVAYKNYISKLKVNAEKTGILEKIRNPKDTIIEMGGASKSVLSSLDNSFFGRQGIKVLLNNPSVWTKNFLKSWKDIKDAIKGGDPIDAIKAEVYSRPNSMNGKYKAGKLDIGLAGEEAFPSAIPERIPVLGRLFKASEQAYNGAAIRMRADLADIYIKLAENKGVNMLDPAQAKPILELANIMTGRGSLGKFDAVAKELNATLFSAKKLAADIQMFTKPFTAETALARRIAAKNLAVTVGTTGAFLYTINLLFPGAVELDPRSSDFGTIKFGNSRVDFTGGAKSIVTLASRQIPTYHKGKWGRWYKSSTTGKWSFLDEPVYGAQNALDVFESFVEGKMSPMLGALRDNMKNTMYGGDEATFKNIMIRNITPLPVQTYQELTNVDGAGPLGLMMLDALGFGVNTY